MTLLIKEPRGGVEGGASGSVLCNTPQKSHKKVSTGKFGWIMSAGLKGNFKQTAKSTDEKIVMFYLPKYL